MATFSVPTMSCDHCKAKIENAVEKLDGVGSVLVDLDTHKVTVEGSAEASAIAAAINDAGYEATLL